jgi:nucleoside-diphosphate-sugar epimerase
MKRSLFITGSTGYLGKHLLSALLPDDYERVVCLTRRMPPKGQARPGVEYVVGDLGDPPSYLTALQGCDTAVHMAAATGKLPRAEYFRVNETGTRVLVNACQQAGIQQFLHVSTIAVQFPDLSNYYYGQSKKAAESIVANSGMAYAIVRPTIILGPGAPVLEGLARMASAPVMPVFGDGRTRVQPVAVEDLVVLMLNILRNGDFRNQIVEAGGPDVMTIEELLVMIRRILFRLPPRRVHIPLRPVTAVLEAFEKLMPPVLPLTAGQLASFANDGSVHFEPAATAWKRPRKSVEQVLTAIAHEPKAA